MSPTVSIIMSEFGSVRKNAGDAHLPSDRLEPALSSARECFPEAQILAYTDGTWECPPEVPYQLVQPLFDRRHPRFGWRAHDFFQAQGLLDAATDVAIAIDTDMLVVSPAFKTLVPIAQRFGFCAPINSRNPVRSEFHAVDGAPLDDRSQGNGTLTYTALFAFDTSNPRARKLLERYRDLLLETPGRAPPLLWKASWETGVAPYILPPQWCVGGGHVGIGAEIVLHVGHAAVRRHYRV